VRTRGLQAEPAQRSLARPVPLSSSQKKPKLPTDARRSEPELPASFLDDLDDLDDDTPYEPRRRWWRPSGPTGRVLLALGLLAIIGAAVALAVVTRNLFGQDAQFLLAGPELVQVNGTGQVSQAEILPLFNQDLGRSVFFVPLSERRLQLEKIPWVEKATVMRVWPNQLRVNVSERTPVAFVRQGPMDQQIGLVDANGILLTMPPAMMAQYHYSFPVVTGIHASDPLAARSRRMALYGRMIHELDADGHKLSEQISEIDLTDLADVHILMPEPGADILVHLGQQHFLESYRIYKAHIAEWRQQYPHLTSVDLRYEQQAVLKQSNKTPAVANEVDANATPDAKKAEEPAKKDAAKPAKDKPAQGKSAPDKSVHDKSAHDKSAHDKSVHDRSAREKPASTTETATSETAAKASATKASATKGTGAAKTPSKRPIAQTTPGKAHTGVRAARLHRTALLHSKQPANAADQTMSQRGPKG